MRPFRWLCALAALITIFGCAAPTQSAQPTPAAPTAVPLIATTAPLTLAPSPTAEPSAAPTELAIPQTTAPLADNPAKPAAPVKLIFIHHSTGGYWLADDYGGLGKALRDNNYFVSATNYGWGQNGIGDRTDMGNWWEWFRGPNSAGYMNALYAETGQHIGGYGDYSRLAVGPGGPNQIVLFKSCYPNSELRGSPTDPVPDIASNPMRDQFAGSDTYTVANAKGIYRDILEYFRQHPEKLFVVITAPPRSDGTYAANARAFNQWLMYNWRQEASYPYQNVAVFDYYNVLTTNGGNKDQNDLGAPTGNHHRWLNGAEQHLTNAGANTLAYPTGDDHPSPAGDQKATAEFVTLLNVFYNRWKNDQGSIPLTRAVYLPLVIR